MKKVSLSVADFAVPSPLLGSIDSYSGYGRGAELGIEIHQNIQREREKLHPHYKAEITVRQQLDSEEYTFQVNGRMDGIFEKNENCHRTKIEEIKSSFNIFELGKRIRETHENHPYVWQLKTYGYFHFLKTGEIPELSLLLVSSRNFETQSIEIKLNIELYKKWLDRRMQELAQEALRAEKRFKRRQKASQNLTFPFAKPRMGQVDLIATIEEGMRESRPMLIQAPTGLGKTIGVIYPTLREALGRGQSLVYLTPKNSQHSVAEDAMDRLQAQGVSLRSMTLTAKSKMCFKNEPICNPDFCEFAKDHYTKVAEHQIVEQLSRKKNLTARAFKKIAKDHEVCPFEIQLDALVDADAVICDYNYVFGPRSPLNRMEGLKFEAQGKPNLVIDEAHNMPSRTMDYYSPQISVFTLDRMREDVKSLPRKFRDEVLELLNSSIQVVKSCAPPAISKACEIKPPLAPFLLQDQQLRNFLSTYLKSDVDIKPQDVVLRLSFYWSEFTEALEFLGAGRKEFFTTFQFNPEAVKITCCDASEMLKDSYTKYSQVVAFSATLKPFDFYSRLSGLLSKELKTAEFVSPFKKENRKVLIIPQISSKYSEREKSYPRVADAIQRIISLKRGNYFAFFPSFDFLYRVLGEFKAPEGVSVLAQQRGMQKDEIDHWIEKLKEPGPAHIIFAVQGGVFSEGVDYPGEMIIGAFVVGPPLPIFDLEREKMREYYQAHYGEGFDYAYTYPAMAKAVQSAGRVIRSETDRGIIVLMDSRFTQGSYVKSMPQDWFQTSASELVSDSILKDISKFWQKK